uniref:NADH-ubiquinone oxidoreductase chain 6 n=1 Tax=Lordithon arcuatus TaxID=2992776 RepID=A0A9E8ADF6_9COLE|nr:NADH dehydrogenase subunit 6 [Lordithon arcuatus]UZA61076.1 NADH dehydrogenase subunit 6 [Lordithon arcuatus]
MTLIILSLIFTTIFVLMNHPLTMGITLLLQTIIISLISGLLFLNFWYSYILFLIMVGGMLVLFVYMTSIASNEKFKFSLKISLFSSIFLFTLMSIWFISDKFMSPIFMKTNSINFMNMYELTLNKFINYPMMNIFLMIIIYLFITLVAVVKITNLKIGPLRPSA